MMDRPRVAVTDRQQRVEIPSSPLLRSEEAEQVLLGDPLELSFEVEREGEERWAFLGETDEHRILQVVITMRGEKIRVVTAFEPAKRLRKLYRQ